MCSHPHPPHPTPHTPHPHRKQGLDKGAFEATEPKGKKMKKQVSFAEDGPSGGGEGSQPLRRTPVTVQDMPESEVTLSKELREGVSGFAVWHRGRKEGGWSDDVINPVLERLRVAREAKELTAEKRDDAFEVLQAEVDEMVCSVVSPADELPKTKLVALTRYIFQACDFNNVTKMTASLAAMKNYLDTLGGARLHSVIKWPPRTTKVPLPSDWPRPIIPKETGDGAGSSSGAGLLLLGFSGNVDVSATQAPSSSTFASRFGKYEVDASSPFAQFVPVGPPAWLNEALRFQSEEAFLLRNVPIMFRFMRDDSDELVWYFGKIIGVLKDATDTVTVVEGDLEGERPKNFAIEYEDDERVKHLLGMDEYAMSADADEGCWCLLGSTGNKSKGKGKAKVESRIVDDDWS